MTHPLVVRLRFTRNKWREASNGVTDKESLRRFEPINSIGWMVGHLANHERLLWLELAQGLDDFADELSPYGWGQPASTPHLSDVMRLYDAVLPQCDVFLDGLTEADMLHTFIRDGKLYRERTGQIVLRLTYHYWYHLGEMQAVRQLLGHRDLPGYVGRIEGDIYAPD